jgi:hypothetical protein
MVFVSFCWLAVFGSDESDGNDLDLVPAEPVFLAALVSGFTVLFEHPLVGTVAGFEVLQLGFDFGCHGLVFWMA